METKPSPKRTRRPRKRADGVKNLTEEQKTERDATMRAWLNQRKIERVAMASSLLPDSGLLRRESLGLASN